MIETAVSIEFERQQQEGRTEAKAAEMPLLGDWIVREFYVTIDDAMNAITNFGSTRRLLSSICFNSPAARNGENGVALTIPECQSPPPIGHLGTGIRPPKFMGIRPPSQGR